MLQFVGQLPKSSLFGGFFLALSARKSHLYQFRMSCLPAALVFSIRLQLRALHPLDRPDPASSTWSYREHPADTSYLLICKANTGWYANTHEVLTYRDTVGPYADVHGLWENSGPASCKCLHGSLIYQRICLKMIRFLQLLKMLVNSQGLWPEIFQRLHMSFTREKMWYWQYEHRLNNSDVHCDDIFLHLFQCNVLIYEQTSSLMSSLQWFSILNLRHSVHTVRYLFTPV